MKWDHFWMWFCFVLAQVRSYPSNQFLWCVSLIPVVSSFAEGSEVFVFTHWHQRGLVILQLHKPSISSKYTRHLPVRHPPTLLPPKVFELRFEDEFGAKKVWRNAPPMCPQGYAFVLVHQTYLQRSLDFTNPVRSFCGGSYLWWVFSSPCHLGGQPKKNIGW